MAYNISEKMKYEHARFAGSFPDYKSSPRTGLPEVAFGGRSNVGKSSLINTLLRRKKLAQISKTPGKTRLLNYYVLSDQAGRDGVFFVDLPGYGYAQVPDAVRKEWKNLVEGYIANSAHLQGFALLIDSRRGLQDEELQLIEYLLSLERHICPVLTKADKLSRAEGTNRVRETATALKKFGPAVAMPILHSSEKKTGNDLIWHWIFERINSESK